MKIALAPMDGITDLAYRTICKELFETHGNPDDELMLRTEFMSADGYVINPPGVIKHLRKTDFEPQLIAQIFGGNGETLLKCAMDIEKTYKFAGVEINMGCPSPGVMKCAAGSAMLKDKVNALKILKTISQQLNLPLSLKTRVGLSEDDKDEQFQFLLEISQYVRMISVHGRTYKQSHSGEVDREFIWRLKQKLPDKVIIGNGGIRSYDDAKQHYSPGLEEKGPGLGASTVAEDKTRPVFLDGIMIAQSAIGNPRILTPHQPSLQERFSVIKRHLRLMMASEYLFEKAVSQMKRKITMPTYGQLNELAETIEKYMNHPYRTPLEFRKYLFNYISGLPGNKGVKKHISGRKTFDQLRSGLQEYETQLMKETTTA